MIRRVGYFVGALATAALVTPSLALAASTITYTYDAFGQLTAVSSTAGRSVSYTYDAAGNRTNMTATGTTALNTPRNGPASLGVPTPDRRSAPNAQAANAPQTLGGRAR